MKSLIPIAISSLFFVSSCSKEESISVITTPEVAVTESEYPLANTSEVIKVPLLEPIKKHQSTLMEQALDGRTLFDINGELLAKPIEKKVKFYVIYITAEWSAKCKEHIDEVKDAYLKEISPHPNVELVMVSIDQNSSWLEKWATEEAFQWPILMNQQRLEVAPIEKLGDGYARVFMLLDENGERKQAYTLEECIEFIKKLAT